MKRLLLTIALTCTLCSLCFAAEPAKSADQQTEVKIKKKKKSKSPKVVVSCSAAQPSEQQNQAQQSNQAPESAINPALIAANGMGQGQDKNGMRQKGDKGMTDDQCPSNPNKINPDFRLA